MSPARQSEHALDRLLNELVDGSLTDDDERLLTDMLRADVCARRRYRQFMALHADLLWDYASAVTPRPVSQLLPPPENSGRNRRWKLLSAATAALLLIIASSLFLPWKWHSGESLRSPRIGLVTPVAGDVQLIAGTEVLSIGRETELRSGTGIHIVGLAGLAVLRLHDGTEISLAGETHVVCQRQHDQTSITLHRGHLSANVTPRQAPHVLQIHTPNAELSVLGTRLAVSATDEISELGVLQGRVQLKRLSDGQTVDVGSGQYAVVSQRVSLEPRPWPDTMESWHEDFEQGLPVGWRYGQWLREGPAEGAHGVVRAARQFALDGSESQLHRITLPRQWMQGLWRLQDDTVLHFTYKMSRPGWFHIMMGVRSDDLNPAHIGNYELQSSHWKMAPPDQWQTVSVPFSEFRKNIRGVSYHELPSSAPRVGDVAYLLWFNTGNVDRGLVIDRIWVDRRSQITEGSR